MPRSSARRLASKAAGGLGRLVLLAGVLAIAATFLPSLLGSSPPTPCAVVT